jgi:hypothetical protein
MKLHGHNVAPQVVSHVLAWLPLRNEINIHARSKISQDLGKLMHLVEAHAVD